MQGRAQPLRVEVVWDGAIATVTLRGNWTPPRPACPGRLIEVVAARPEWLVLDLSGLAFVDAAGGRALDRAYSP